MELFASKRDDSWLNGNASSHGSITAAFKLSLAKPLVMGIDQKLCASELKTLLPKGDVCATVRHAKTTPSLNIHCEPPFA